jgi:hypothetical protein
VGGQACVFYGAAEFSRDVDLLVLADAENLGCLRSALDALDAEVIAVPDFEQGACCAGTPSISAAAGRMWRVCELT